MTELTIDQALQHGIEAHKAGQVQEADRLYTAILKAQPKHPDANHNMGVLAVGVGKVEQALWFFKTALEASPGTDQFWLSYIDALIKLGKLADAKAVFDQAKSKGAKGDGFDKLEQQLKEANKEYHLDDILTETLETNQNSTLDIAVQARETGKFNLAIELLTDVISRCPEDVDMLALLSHCYLLADQLDLAKLYLEKATSIAPDNASVGWNTARLMLKEQKPSEAVNVARDNSQKFPDDVEGMGVLGACLRANGEIVESLNVLNRAIELNPNHAETLINRGLIKLSQGNVPEALADLELAHRLKPHIKQIWDLVVRLKMEAQEYSDAIVFLSNMIEIDPENENRLATLALCYQYLKNFDSAIEAYQKALAIKPDNAMVHTNLGSAFKIQGKLDEAIVAYRNALAIKPDNADAYNNMGNALQKQGKLKKAIVAFNKALAIKPDNAEACYNMGNTLQEQGKLEEAIEAYNKALAIKPDYAAAYNNMGVTFKYQGKPEEEIEAYNKALAIKPDYAEASFNTALSLYGDGKYEKAAQLFSKDNSISSQGNLLKCLFELGEQSKFNRKLDYLVERGENNCLIGSFISRSETRYGMKKHNPFCNDPLKYVLQTDLTKECDFKKIFVENAAKVLSNDEVKHKSSKKGLFTNAIQTSGNIFNQVGSVTNLWQDIIHSELKKYKDHFCNSEEGLIKYWPTDYSIYGWLVSMKSGGELSAHFHDTGWITGSIYINVPPKSKEDSGNLVVTTHDSKHGIGKTENSKSIDVVTGSLCLFPSSLLHYTIPFESDHDRITLAFDIIPRK